ncbi:hypothetical protein CJD36_002500 [Flavipsychrobacter stenotrophus]|uniref:NAD(+) hydrolase ThsA n=1 Tax=Flavipsychrobacter stenotrophus TaxID=2077091 RepID=A0A2S7T0B8_9BACT|nr:SIR2 family protein [Flavipsychrobacter stenotrophus]PQJ12632.1 hypothetical protein CJD36_002500 [Flavipsychrobacter stenotrophus]
MNFSREVEAFIKEFVNDLTEKNAAIFAGAGMSRGAGYVDWAELLNDIAEEIGLKIKIENDLISLAQYHFNERGGSAGLIKKILREFSEEVEPTETHKILARLPISTYWTTNYDTLIEDSLKQAFKVVDVKHEIDQLTSTRPKRDVVVYKMHGDVHHSSKAIITKAQYETYYATHAPFVTALSGDLVSKTFLFIGFSFTDPNLDYVLSRLNYQFGAIKKQHYCFIKNESKNPDDDDELFKYKERKQKLRIDDLKRYGIKALLIDDYQDVSEILKEIERRFRKKTIFISGSAEEYGKWNRNDAQSFIHSLSKKLVNNNYRVVNGFGWGVGSAIINGALEAVYEKPEKYSEDQLIVKPFPQFETGEKKLADLWEEYRQRMISLAGVAIFIFGNKSDGKGNIISANGVKREFEIAIQQGLIPIPIPSTGYVSSEIYNDIINGAHEYYKGVESIIPIIKHLGAEHITPEEIIKNIISIIQTINK